MVLQQPQPKGQPHGLVVLARHWREKDAEALGNRLDFDVRDVREGIAHLQPLKHGGRKGGELEAAKAREIVAVKLGADVADKRGIDSAWNRQDAGRGMGIRGQRDFADGRADQFGSKLHDQAIEAHGGRSASVKKDAELQKLARAWQVQRQDHCARRIELQRRGPSAPILHVFADASRHKVAGGSDLGQRQREILGSRYFF